MMMAMAQKKTIIKSMIVFLFIFFFSFVQAEIAVTISPQNGEETASMYQDEAMLFNLNVINLNPEPVQNLVIELSVDKELALLEENGLSESSSKNYRIEFLAPGEGASQPFLLKALAKTQNAKIYANYGVNVFTNLSASFVQIVDSPIQLNASLEKKELDLGEKNSIIASIENSSSNAFSNLELSLIADETIFSEEKSFHFASISSKQKISQEFSFYPKETIQGEKRLVVQLKFEDEKSNERVLQKNLSVNIQNKKLNLALIIAAIIFLLILAFWGL